MKAYMDTREEKGFVIIFRLLQKFVLSMDPFSLIYLQMPFIHGGIEKKRNETY
jgi:hypothetical protein